MAGHQHHAADAGRRRGAARLADALDRQRRRLGARARSLQRARPTAASGSSRSRSGMRARQQRGIGKAGELVLGRDPRHRDRALGQRARRRRAMSLVETTAWRRPTSTRRPDVVAFGALGFLDRAVAHLDRRDTERTATASAASAPARRAASTSRSASAVRADWSRREAMRGFLIGCEGAVERLTANRRNAATSRQA